VLACAGVPAGVSAVQTTWVLTRGHVPLRPARALVTGPAVRSLSRLSGLFFVLNVAVAVAFSSDAVIVAAGLGAAAAATFAVGLRLFGALGSVLAGASQQLWTAVADALACGDVAWARARVCRVVGLTLAAAVPLAGGLVLAAGPVARMWLGAAFVPSLPLRLAFAVWTVYWLLMTQLSYVLSAAAVVGPQVVMALAMAGLNVALSVWLTARVGTAGPLVGSLLAHLVCSGVPTVLMVARVLRPTGDGAEAG
jgi:O-antigen/teichoic acid export membrane protein